MNQISQLTQKTVVSHVHENNSPDVNIERVSGKWYKLAHYKFSYGEIMLTKRFKDMAAYGALTVVLAAGAVCLRAIQKDYQKSMAQIEALHNTTDELLRAVPRSVLGSSKYLEMNRHAKNPGQTPVEPSAASKVVESQKPALQ